MRDAEPPPSSSIFTTRIARRNRTLVERKGPRKKPNLLSRFVSESRFGSEGNSGDGSGSEHQDGRGPSQGRLQWMSQPEARLSDPSPCDRRSDPLGWNWRRSRSASPGGPPDGRHVLTCHHDAPGDSASPFKSRVHRCGFLGLRFIHRQKLPTSRNATPNVRSTLHYSLSPSGNTSSTRHRHPGIDQASRYGSPNAAGRPTYSVSHNPGLTR